jgi:hypothetical protein
MCAIRLNILDGLLNYRGLEWNRRRCIPKRVPSKLTQLQGTEPLHDISPVPADGWKPF